jgi:hypothetical protein
METVNKKLCMSGGRKVAAPPSDLLGDRLVICPKEIFITGKHQRNTTDGFKPRGRTDVGRPRKR